MATLENRPNTALLVVDVQNVVVQGAHERDAVVANINRLVDRARQEGVPVVWVQHSDKEIVGLAVRSLKALDVFVGGTEFLMGDEPCGADAFVFATLAAAMTPYFPSPVRDAAIKFPRLVAYVSRMFDRFYPDFEWDAGIPEIRQAA